MNDQTSHQKQTNKNIEFLASAPFTLLIPTIVTENDNWPIRERMRERRKGGEKRKRNREWESKRARERERAIFPATTIKFNDLCTNEEYHREARDYAVF